MKTVILVISGVCLAGIAGFYLGRPSHETAAEKESVAQASEPAAETQLPATAHAPTRERNVSPLTESQESTATPGSEANPKGAGGASTIAKTPVAQLFNQALETLVSPQVNYQQKQAAWQQLRNSGKLDQAISELEQRAAANPAVPELPATLGQAYLQKAGTIQDIREQGILGMKADQSFEAALNIDSSNWEARFWKATAMSYWPPQLNKGKEVIEQFLDCVKIQESQAPSPQFAQTYVLLGEQYQKQGYSDYATQTWRRGLSYFPNDESLQKKLSGGQ